MRVVAVLVIALAACRSPSTKTNDKPPSFARCGSHACDVATSYCEIVLSDVADPPTDYACKPLPPSCVFTDGAAPTCACFPKSTRCLSFCGPIDTDGGVPGIHLTCRL